MLITHTGVLELAFVYQRRFRVSLGLVARGALTLVRVGALPTLKGAPFLLSVLRLWDQDTPSHSARDCWAGSSGFYL